MGRVQSRKAADLDVPRRNEDPGERKRVLNVLAQRRYRQRRKEHLRKLEAQADVDVPDEVQIQPLDLDFSIEYPDLESSKDILQPIEDLPLSANFESFENTSFPSPQSDTSFWAEQTARLLLSPLPSSNSDTPHSSNTQTYSPISSVNMIDEKPYSFPDEAHLEILELNILRGCFTIAKRLNIDDLIWSLTTTSPFTEACMATSSFNHLPLNLRPTRMQRTYPHHPILDLLPWPSVRDKMIMVMSQPPEFRPPSAATPTALLDFVYDFEDSAEGIRIWGDDPCTEKAWEVGEVLFQKWWWIFNSDIIRRSNELRQIRGAGLLGQGSILGEV